MRSRELPFKVRVDKATHVRLRELKQKHKKSMAQIVIEAVEQYERETRNHS